MFKLLLIFFASPLALVHDPTYFVLSDYIISDERKHTKSHKQGKLPISTWKLTPLLVSQAAQTTKMYQTIPTTTNKDFIDGDSSKISL
jgi:hypothetical protein